MPEALCVVIDVALHEVLVLVEHDAVFVGVALGLAHQVHAGAADAVDGDVAAYQAVGIAVALQLPAELLAAALGGAGGAR